MGTAPLGAPDGRQGFEQALLTGWGRGEHEQHIAFWKGIGDGLIAGFLRQQAGRHEGDVVQPGLPQRAGWAVIRSPAAHAASSSSAAVPLGSKNCRRSNASKYVS